MCRETDQAAAALVQDLKRRGLLDSTLVVWGGEFGRTPMGEVRDTVGRNHHIEGYTMWLAGALVVGGGGGWGRPMGEVGDTVGRNHHIEGYTMWLAGGGVQAGLNLGA